MKNTPATAVTETIAKVILEIQILASDLDQTNTDKLRSDLCEIEDVSSALRTFILNHVVRKA